MQHTLPDRTPSPRPRPGADVVPAPAPQLVQPAAADQHAADGVDDAHQQRRQAAAGLGDRQQNRLDVELEEDAGEGVLGHGPALRRHGVLVGEDGVARAEDGLRGRVAVGRGQPRRRAARVDGRHDGEVVLEPVEVAVGQGQGLVQRVEQGGVERAEGELLD